MKTTTMVKAWEIAHAMTDNLQYDAERTERGCGKTWSKPETNATVIDLGNRLEVNKENGETINIWIEPEEAKKPLTFKVIVTYQTHNSVMTKEMTGVNKVEKVYEKWDGKTVELVKIHFGGYNAATWGAGGILHINMIPEI